MGTQADSTGFTRWDRLVAPYYGAGLVRFGADEELVKRQEYRIGGFETLLAQARAAPDPQSRSRAQQALSTEYDHRLEAWRHWCKNWLKDDDLVRWLAGALLHERAGCAVVLWCPALFTLIGVRRAFKLGSMPRLNRALRRAQCPDCGFDLSHHPPLFDADPHKGPVCPERCPECGGRWPLLPTPPKPRRRAPTPPAPA